MKIDFHSHTTENLSTNKPFCWKSETPITMVSSDRKCLRIEFTGSQRLNLLRLLLSTQQAGNLSVSLYSIYTRPFFLDQSNCRQIISLILSSLTPPEHIVSLSLGPPRRNVSPHTGHVWETSRRSLTKTALCMCVCISVCVLPIPHSTTMSS